MRRERNFLTVAVWIFLLFLGGLAPAEAPGFSVPGDKTKDCAQCHTMKPAKAAELLKDVVKEVRDVIPAHVPGLYAVSVTGKDGRPGIVYIDYSGKYVISGVTIRLEDKENISRLEMIDLTRVDYASIPIKDSLVVGNPKAPKKAFLFTDPLCPFCKKLHPELKKAVQADPQVVFFIKLYPLVSLHPEAMGISQSIMCENSLELLEASFAGKKVPDPACKSDVVDRTVKLAQELGIGSTPTLVLPDGRVATGFRPAEKILELINGK